MGGRKKRYGSGRYTVSGYRVSEVPEAPSPSPKRPKELLRRIIMLLLAVVAAVSAFLLIRYFVWQAQSLRQAEELKALYYRTEEPQPAVPSPQATAEPTQASPRPQATAVPPMPTTVPAYLHNPTLKVSDTFKKLQKTNKDIVAWLSVEGHLDQAVVQRNNSYYLTHDYLGHRNDNGALFLDESCLLEKRPNALIVFGHNMKTEAMFGWLHRYRQLNFYRQNPFVTCNTLYEDGRYVIFAISDISLLNGSLKYLNIYDLNSPDAARREDAICRLYSLSEHPHAVDVAVGDQLLVLVTCTGDDNTRLLVTARRIRDNESEATLQYSIQHTTR